MPATAVVTDSTHYLPREVVAAHDIHEVSLYVSWGADEQVRESEITDLAAFYDRLRTASELPTTSQPSVGDFTAVYEPLLADGGEVVSIHLSGGISGTCQAALQAKAQLAEDGRGGERIEIIDSATAGGGLGLLVLAAAREAQRGSDRRRVAERALAVRHELKVWFAVDTLEYLRRGGRIGAAQAWLGSALRIKPILSIESEITAIERVRTSRRAFERMVEYMRSRLQDGADGWVIQHIQAHEQADALVERGREMFGSEPAFIGEIGPVIGAHVGPGLLGVGGCPASLLA